MKTKTSIVILSIVTAIAFATSITADATVQNKTPAPSGVLGLQVTPVSCTGKLPITIFKRVETAKKVDSEEDLIIPTDTTKSESWMHTILHVPNLLLQNPLTIVADSAYRYTKACPHSHVEVIVRAIPQGAPIK
jgi:hypothetical protein